MAVRLPILTFHDIDERPSVISVSSDVFRFGMRRLTEEGYRTISLSRIVECIRKAEPFPDRAICITFDDGYRSVYERAFPILRRYGMKATVFLTVGDQEKRALQERLASLAGREMLSWSQIREMAREEIDFGSHTLTHPDLTRLPLKQVTSEICDSKSMIEDILGHAVTSFAYPFGYHNRRVREIVRAYYPCACSARLGMAGRRSDPFALERVDMHYFRTVRLFGIMLSSGLLPYVRLRNIPRQIRSLIRRRRWL